MNTLNTKEGDGSSNSYFLLDSKLNLSSPTSEKLGSLDAYLAQAGRVEWAIVEALLGATVSGWASMTSIICFVSGVQLICLGVIGEYIGKIYMETKRRPRYIISDRTWDEDEK